MFQLNYHTAYLSVTFVIQIAALSFDPDGDEEEEEEEVPIVTKKKRLGKSGWSQRRNGLVSQAGP